VPLQPAVRVAGQGGRRRGPFEPLRTDAHGAARSDARIVEVER
jgi:hypothetical protein